MHPLVELRFIASRFDQCLRNLSSGSFFKNRPLWRGGNHNGLFYCTHSTVRRGKVDCCIR